MLRLPVIAGVIDRRVLVNYRCAPEALQRLLPPPFRPKLVAQGRWGIAGICLIRLGHIRPRGLPRPFGLSSENAAHRIAVEWTDPRDGTTREGVYIPRRDSSSVVNQLAGGRLFPGVHHRATFTVTEAGDALRLHVRSNDAENELSLEAAIASALPRESVFRCVEEASDFFRGGSVGFSPSVSEGSPLDAIELRTLQWHVTPLEVTRLSSSYFDDKTRFPAGAAVFDNALLMRHVDHEWHAAAPPSPTSKP
jgi:hypothetical protein